MAKRVLSLVLAVVTVLTLAVPAFAEETEPAEEPTVTQEPAETEAPPAEETEAPAEPEEPAEPEPTEEPAVTEAPAETAEPEVTEEPEATEEPAAEDIAPIAEEEPMAVAEETYSGTCGAKGGKNLTWTLTSNGETNDDGPCYTLTISGTGKMEDYTYYDTKYNEWVNGFGPWAGHPGGDEGPLVENRNISHIVLNSGITHIGADAFSNASIQSIQIPDTVTSIGDFAFVGTGLTDITLPDSVKELGIGVFSNCHALERVRLSRGLTVISDSLFFTCESLTAVDIPNGVTTIDYNAFNSTGLRSLTLPQSVTTIKWGAFSYCDGLTSVEIPVNVKTLGQEAFANCNALTDITILRPDCNIQADKVYGEHLAPEGTVIHGYDGSTAEKYANKYGYTFVSLGKAPTVYKYAAPANIAAEPASTGIKVSWDKVSGASKYRVYYRKDGGGWTKAGDTSKTSYTWTKAAAGTAYEMTVCCLDKNSKIVSDKGTAATFTWAKTPSITLTNTTTGIKASWSSAGAEKYVVTLKDSEKTLIDQQSYTDPALDYSAAESGKTYKVTVQAVDGDGVPMSAAASKSIKFLSAPVIESIERGSTGIKLTWGAVTGAAKYRVYYKTETGKWTKLTDTSSTSYTWKKAKTGTKYYFSVACVDSKGKTVTSAKYEDRMDDRLTILAAPSVTLTNTTEGLEVSWKTVPLAQEYKVTVKQGEDVMEEQTQPETEYLYKAANNTKYTVTVEALGKDEKISDKVSSVKSKTFFDAPAISAVEAVSSGIKLTWNKVEGASKYRIYYATKLKNGKPSWSKLADVSGTAVEGSENLTYTWKKASYKTYWFTVAAMSGKSVASAKHEDMGDTITLLKPPSVTLTNQTNGILVKWSDLKAAKYKVTVNGDVVEPAATGTEYLYTGVTNNNTYTVTVQGLGEDGTGKLGKVSATKSILYLDAPTVTAVEASGSGIKVSWNKVSGAVKYRVYYKTETGKWTKAADTKGTAAEDDENSLTYTWTKAKTGTKYYFTVACIDKNGKKLTSAKHEDKTDDCFTLLAAPSVTVSNQTDGIKISWKSITDAERYIVTVTGSDKAQVDQQTIEANGEEQFSYTCPKEHLTSGVKYTVTVQADGSEKTRGKVSAAKSITYLDAPEVTALEAVSSGIKISWGKVDGASRYRVYYKTEGGSWKTLANTKGTEAGDGILSYTWTKAKPNTKYYFTVVCMDSKYKKATSAKYEDTRYEFTLLAAPGVTAALAKEDGQDVINLSWAAVPGADKYRVSIKKDGAWEKLDDTAETSYSYTELTSGGSYTFTVWCVDRDGTCVSKYASAGKTVKYYPAPTGIKAQIGLAGLEVSWEDVPGAIPEGATRPKDIKYRVYYKTSPDGAWKKACDTTGCAYAWEPTASGDYWLAVACVDKSGKTVLSAMDETAESVHYLWEIDIPAAEKAIEKHGEDVGFTVGGDLGGWDPCTYYGKSMSGLIATGCEVVDSLRDSITEQGRSPSNMRCTIEKAKDHYVITVYYSFV